MTVRGVVELERLATSVPRLDGLVLRYGQLYGPGTWNLAPTGSVPLHVESAARAAALAAVRGVPGVYDIVEDGATASNVSRRSLAGSAPTDRGRPGPTGQDSVLHRWRDQARTVRL